jgi:XTP/dITP diphosphohydrolase
MKLYLASANPHKAAEFRSLGAALGAAGRPATPGFKVEFASAAELGGMPPVVEDAGTFLGNARKKAHALRALLPKDGWALADDSGLCVEALGGAPGVESAYYAGAPGDPTANLAKLVEAMREVPEEGRGAEFTCVLFLCGPAGMERHFEGRCAGRLAREPRGGWGFGYDPLFVPDGFETTLAEMVPERKNSVSHRGRAWAKCVGWLAALG